MLVYVSAFLSNMGNYRGFGDSKFIPVVPKEKLQNLIFNSEAYKKDTKKIEFLWNQIKDKLFSLNEGELSLWFYPKVSWL